MTPPPAPRRTAGLTLIEVVIGLAVMALLLSLALPSFGGHMSRQRLKSAASTLAIDLAEARFEAAQRGQTLYVNLAEGNDWCYALTTTSGCDCRLVQACRLKAVSARDTPGLTLAAAPEIAFAPEGRGAAASLQFASARGERLRVDLSALGRARVCAPDGLAGFTRC